MVEALMGRPKKRPESGGGAGRRTRHVVIRTSDEWAEWLDRVARHCRIDMSKLVDSAVADYARSRGFEEPPPRRY